MSRPEETFFNRRIGDEVDWLDGLIRRARANASELRDSDIRFVDDMFVRTGQFGRFTIVSEKQRAWLDDIERRLDEAGVPKAEDDPGDAVARPVDEEMER